MRMITTKIVRKMIRPMIMSETGDYLIRVSKGTTFLIRRYGDISNPNHVQ
jgi:hypothetical protein